MKLNWDCIREILVAIEAEPFVTCQLHPRRVRGWDEDEVSGHMYLLREHGIITAKCVPLGDDRVFCVATGLTFEGHELLGKLNSSALWLGIKRLAHEKGLEVTFDLVKTLAPIVLSALAKP